MNWVRGHQNRWPRDSSEAGLRNLALLLLFRDLLATHCGRPSSDQPLLLPPTAAEVTFRRSADSSRGYVHALKFLPR